MIGRTDAERRAIEERAQAFGSPVFRLDASTGTLWRDETPQPLRAKTLAVLEALIAREGGVVGPLELRDEVWGRRHGSENGPKQCVRELRRHFGESLETPGFIETVGRIGYRFIGDIVLIGPKTPARDGPGGDPSPLCAGRARERARLLGALDAARRGARAVCAISGEAGAGKTRLVDAFAAGSAGLPGAWFARGQCIPMEGAREPYGPIFEALRQLGDAAPSGVAVARILREAAPSFAPILQGQAPRTEAPGARIEAGGSSPERMLRELVDVFERLTRETPGVLVLEDLHWADRSTLDWLRGWSLRRAPARLMVIGTHRAEETHSDLADALADLSRATGFQSIALGGLDAAAIGEILDHRFPGHALPATLGAGLAERTEGHAILVAGVIDDWATSGLIRQEGAGWTVAGGAEALLAAAPSAVRTFIDRQIDRLTPQERSLLEAASIPGPGFSAAALAEDAEDLETVEMACATLARRGLFIEAVGPVTWPDGTVASGFTFRHALYREALQEGLPAASRRGLHRRIGARLEAGYGARAEEIAPGLAEHFECAGDMPRATRYRRLSGEQALERGAARAAADQLRRARDLNEHLPQSPARDAAELDILMSLGAAVVGADGFADPALPEIHARIGALSREVSDHSTLIPVLAGLWNYHLTRADIGAAVRLAGVLEGLAVDPATDAALGMAAHNAVGATFWLTGAPARALPHIAAVLGTYEIGLHGGLAARFGEDPGVACRRYAAVAHQLLDEPEAAERLFEAALEIALSLRQPFGMAQTFWSGAVIARDRGDISTVGARAAALIDACETGETTFWLPGGRMFAGWAACALGDPSGLAEISEGLEDWRRAGVALTRPYNLGMLAEAHVMSGRHAEARALVDEALELARRTGEMWCAPGLLQLSGLLEQDAGAVGTRSGP